MPSFFVPNEARIEVNGYVLFFCVAVSALTGILFGLAPALQSSRPDLVEALKDDSRSSGASAGGRTRALLVVAEVALSVVLLVGAGLTIRSFIALQQVDLGFQSRAGDECWACLCLPNDTRPGSSATVSLRSCLSG